MYNMHFIIFGFEGCGACRNSKDTIKSKKHTYTFVKLSNFDWDEFAKSVKLLKKHKWLKKNVEFNSVPIIFIKQNENKIPKYIGGYENLLKII